MSSLFPPKDESASAGEMPAGNSETSTEDNSTTANSITPMAGTSSGAASSGIAPSFAVVLPAENWTVPTAGVLSVSQVEGALPSPSTPSTPTTLGSYVADAMPLGAIRNIDHNVVLEGKQIWIVFKQSIGSGDQGKVFAAYCAQQKLDAAVKVSPVGTRPCEEVQFLTKLQHENIVKLYDVLENPADFPSCVCIVMEKLLCSLQVWLDAKGVGLPECILPKYLRQILLGLDYLHSQDPGIVHLNLKPSNVLLSSSGVVRLAGFGLSQLSGAPLGG
eukprot:RCo009291